MFPTDTSAMLDSAPVDTAPETDAIDTADTGIDTADSVDTDTVDEPQTDEPTPEPADVEPFTGKAVENGKINPAAKALLDELKAKSPALEKQIRNALMRQDVMSRELPGGVQAVKQKIGELESTIQELGGRDGIARTKQELEFFNNLDGQFTAGDPRFIESLIASPEGQASFLKLAPSMIEKYASMHPEGFGAYIAGKFKGELENHDVKLGLIRMQDHIERMPDGPEKAGIAQQWGQLVGFHNDVMGKAAKKPEMPKIEGTGQQPKQDDGREQQLSQREQKVKDQEYAGVWNRELVGVVTPELSRLRGERKFADIDKARGQAAGSTEAAIKELFSSRFDKLIAAKGTNISKFYKAGDIAGYQAAIRQLFRDEAPKIMSQVVDHFAPRTGKRVPPTNKPLMPGTPQAKPGNDGPFVGVREKPSAGEVDFTKTTMEMWTAEGKAVLKDGRRVRFGR